MGIKVWNFVFLVKKEKHLLIKLNNNSRNRSYKWPIFFIKNTLSFFLDSGKIDGVILNEP